VKDARLYLIHILESAEKVEDYTRKGRDAFMDSPMTQDAVVRNFEVIGEAVKQIPDHLKQEHPDIPWRRIAGLRDVLIHQYMSVDLERYGQSLRMNFPSSGRQLPRSSPDCRIIDHGISLCRRVWLVPRLQRPESCR